MTRPGPLPPHLDHAARQILLRVARDAIEYGERSGKIFRPTLDAKAGLPNRTHGCFVTLHLDGALRGCVGTLSSDESLAVAAARSAHRAAFEDPRFSPVTPEERSRLEIEISVLSESQPIQAANEKDLLEQIEPGIDGLILREQEKSSTFLPEVWETLPDPHRFLGQLKRKAGLAEDHWSTTLRFERYRTLHFGDEDEPSFDTNDQRASRRER